MAFLGDEENLGAAVRWVWGVGLGGRAIVTTSPEAGTRGCCLCTMEIRRRRNSKPAKNDLTVAASGELAGKVKHFQVVKAVGSEVLGWDWDCLQRSVAWPSCERWI